MRNYIIFITVVLIGEFGFQPLRSQTDSAICKELFVSPDSSYYPGVWWWWLRCPTTKEAITLDLEEMKAKKIYSVQLLDFGTGGGQKRMPGYLELASSEWNEMVRHSILECKRLGLEFSVCIATSGCAAPWVKPEDSQQKLVYSEVKVKGGQPVKVKMPYSVDVKMNGEGFPVCYQDIALLAIPDKGIISKSEIVDISVVMDKDGVVNWNAPAGNWKIYRFGFTPTFKAMNEFKYLDHLRTDVFDEYYQRYIGRLLGSLSKEEKSAVKYIVSDSWEAGVAGWSRTFAKEFVKRRGYDPILYLPVFAGEVVDSQDISHRFMNDYKRTVSDLITEHYRYQQEVAYRDGLLTMCEASGPHQNQADALLCQKYSDVPMGEFWARSKTHRTSLKERFLTKEAVSAGHIYGKTIISSESFTSVGPQWEEDPYFLKPSADRAFCEGINKLYFHTFPHSPSLTAKPGFVYYAGTYINRNTTWWDYSLDWNTYLARNQYLLQQGIPVVDVCLYYGAGIEKRIQYKQDSSLVDPGYQYDYVNSDVILNRMTVQNGKICLPDGLSYELLVLPEENEMPLAVLEKIREMVYEGAIVVGPKPVSSVGLYDMEEADRKLKDIVDILWGNKNEPVIDRIVGKGKVIYGKSINQILAEKNVKPDLKIESGNSDLSLDFIHRRDNNTDIYYLANLKEKSDCATLSFRVSGKIPQIWNSVDGTVVDQRVYVDDGERIHIPCSFDPFESLFIVFKEAKEKRPSVVSVMGPDGDKSCFFEKPGKYKLHYSDGKGKNIVIHPAYCKTIDTSWRVSFSTEMGGPDDVEFAKLISWPDSDNPGIKYYAGTASYLNTFVVKNKIKEGSKVILDLGELYNVAEIILNGHNLGTCWMKPFRKDISEYVKQGSNEIEIKVTNLWPNRLIGDQFLPEEKRYTLTNISKYTRQDTLRPSGLLGPVQIKIIPANLDL